MEVKIEVKSRLSSINQFSQMISDSILLMFLLIICIFDMNLSIFVIMSEFMLKNFAAYLVLSRISEVQTVWPFIALLLRFILLISSSIIILIFFFCMYLQLASFTGISRDFFAHIHLLDPYRILFPTPIDFILANQIEHFLIRLQGKRFCFHNFLQFVYCWIQLPLYFKQMIV